MNSQENAVIILCAGSGQRMGRKMPKMLLPILGKPLYYWTITQISRCPAVGSIVLAAPQEFLAKFKAGVARYKLKKVSAIVAGGAERSDSTRAAMAVLPPTVKWVGIHDGARPFARATLVENVFLAARKTSAAIPVVAVKDTIKKISPHGQIIKTVPRQDLAQAQTPQVFSRVLAEKIHSDKNKMQFTDDAQAAELLGFSVQTVAGSHFNIKVTTPEDLIFAEAILKRKKYR